MELIRVILLFLALIITVSSVPNPGGHHHIIHRIHVPQKIKTVYHTKIIKVPEHHHHFHEKEKIIIEKPKKEEPIKLHHEDFHSFGDDESLSQHYGGADEHNIFKKHAEPPKNHKSTPKKTRKRKTEKRD